MRTEEHNQITLVDRNVYIPPAIEVELDLETRAGSALGLPDGIEGLGE